MDKKIIWEYHNPKEFYEKAFSKIQNRDNDDWNQDGAGEMPVLTNPFGPKEYWIAHTNFKLTTKHFNILEFHLDGVESFKFLSNYRMVIAIAECFDYMDVRLDIEKVFCDKHLTYTEDSELNNVIQEKKTELSKYNFWKMYVLPNGKIFSIQSNTIDDSFLNVSKQLIDLSKDINGILIESETCQNQKI